MLSGTEAAHWLAFTLVYPNAWERSQALQASGHAYFSYWPAFAAIGITLVAASLLLQVRDHLRAGVGSVIQPSPLMFAALPPLTFALQEHLEAVVHSGSIAGVAESPTFVVGLALQLPFAGVAYLCARFLLRVAQFVARVLRAPAVWGLTGGGRGWQPCIVQLWSLAQLGASPGRGPPQLV
jgi:hypothetical protein